MSEKLSVEFRGVLSSSGQPMVEITFSDGPRYVIPVAHALEMAETLADTAAETRDVADARAMTPANVWKNHFRKL